MGFSTYSFLFLFFPISLLVYCITCFGGKALKLSGLGKLSLLLISLIFFSWSEWRSLPYMLGFSLLIYLCGKLLCNRQGGDRRAVLVVMCLLMAAALIFIKSFNMVSTRLTQHFGAERFPLRSLLVPLGISYIFFSAVSYLVDSYRGVKGSLLDFLLYIFFFPRIVSGPVFFWKDHLKQSPALSLHGVYSGIRRMLIGFSKKLIIADGIAQYIYSLQHYSVDVMDVPSAWLMCFAYYLQIYFDFSAYTDMALGVAECFGYELPDNFDHPYVSASVGEFWRRWHKSLGAWFREYLYIPLGGSRGGLKKTLRNLALVFVATGVWHGVGIGYLIWGCAHGALVCFERIPRIKSFLEKIPRAIRIIIVQLFVMLGWLFFCFNSAGGAFAHVKLMLGLGSGRSALAWDYFLRARQLFLLAAAVIISILPLIPGYKKLKGVARDTRAGRVVCDTVLMLLAAYSYMLMAKNGYSPFLYFQYR